MAVLLLPLLFLFLLVLGVVVDGEEEGEELAKTTEVVVVVDGV